jgi:hypothetical protein
MIYLLFDLHLDRGNNNLKQDPRRCSVTVQTGPIGISLQSDEDFGHIIEKVEANSPADHAGIEQDDCIISLNNTLLLNLPYADVLSFLRKTREEINMDFIVAKKSYLLKSYQNNITDEELPSTNLTEKNVSFSLPAEKTLEQLYDKYTKEQTNLNQRNKSISTNEQYDRLSAHPIYTNRYSSKRYEGKVLQGSGPAITDRFSGNIQSEKGVDNSSARSDLYGRRTGNRLNKYIKNIFLSIGMNGHSSLPKDTFQPFQVGITNPSPTQRSREIPSSFANISISDDGQRTYPPTPHIERDHNQTIQNILDAVPIAPDKPSRAMDFYERGSSTVCFALELSFYITIYRMTTFSAL